MSCCYDDPSNDPYNIFVSGRVRHEYSEAEDNLHCTVQIIDEAEAKSLSSCIQNDRIHNTGNLFRTDDKAKERIKNINDDNNRIICNVDKENEDGIAENHFAVSRKDQFENNFRLLGNLTSRVINFNSETRKVKLV